ncbi:hypothetical protein [Staphylococcus pettenkoferi]|uniref:hypothetical protein n=1 Tax=Staphylococcus pettenkoferi TaxID=170573 RepID=UPI0011AAE46C|nr:hypothetical protein [Staphylococcus pettenkoferi]MBX8994096.1 hypothetical protein [Staphylococcus pettenkoferi]MCY1567126.1 hypothetical protein [Staphylococcus pettenkoferi]MCY1588532.1 hypothetical protein [Staphylococcus pettenkoferi]
MKKLAKNLSLFIAFALFVTMLSGCGKSIKNKKEVTIRDIINDSETHFLYATEPKDGVHESNEGYLTKNGKVKHITFKHPVEISKLSQTKGKDIEKKFKLDSSKEDNNNKWQKVKSYGEIVDKQGNPLMTCVFSSKRTEKSFKDGSLYPNLASSDCLFYYSSQKALSPQGAKTTNLTLGKFDASFEKMVQARAQITGGHEEVIRRDNEDFGLNYHVVLPEKVKKIKNVKSDDKDVVTSEFEHGFLE